MKISRYSMKHALACKGSSAICVVSHAWLSVVLALLMLGLGTVPATQAATTCVNPTGTDACYSTIQAAITAAASGDTINVAAGTYTENLSIFDKNLTINGAGAGKTIIDGNASANGWIVYSNSQLALTGVTITNGNGPAGGGGIYNAGAMTLAGSDVSVNSASVFGGGIANFGTATIENSSISGNKTSGSGGGIVNGDTLTIRDSTIANNSALGGDGGGIYNSAGQLTIIGSAIAGNSASGVAGGIVNFSLTPVSIVNSTISGNTATGNGGGIVNGGSSTLALTNSTVANNKGGIAGNVYNSGTLQLKNTILAYSASPNANCANFGTVSSLGNNLDSGTSCFTPAAGDLTNTDPLLGPLANNGGPTPTHALLTGSPAINAADNSDCPATDQSGTTRPQGPICDIGAFELVDNVAPVLGACPPGDPFAFNTGVQPVGPIAASDTGSGILASASTLAGVVDTSLPGIQRLTFTAVDRVGNVTPTNCRYNVTVYTAEQKVSADVSALRATVTDKNSGKKLDEALAKLTKALDSTLWLPDGNHLQPKDGNKSFAAAKDAVKNLSEVAKNPPYDALVRGSITALVEANRKLAQIAVVDAASQNGKEKEIANANQELGKGDKYTDDGKYNDAVDHYGKAWEHALKALN
jgi:hypothetical protein